MPIQNIRGKNLQITSHPPSDPSITTTTTTANPPPISTTTNTLTCIFIPGLGASESYFHPLLPSLSKYHCITFDLHGSARSPSQGEPQTIPGIAADVIAILDAHHVAKAVIVGHSLGGLVGVHLAAEYEERILGLVAIAPSVPSLRARERFLARIEEVKTMGIEHLASTRPTQVTGTLSTPLHHAFIREMHMQQPVTGYIRLVEMLAAAEKPRYEAVKVPVLIIGGREDRSVTEADGREMLAALRSVGGGGGGGGGSSDSKKRLEMVEGVAHWLCIEAYEEVGGMVARFCEELDDGVQGGGGGGP